MRSIEGKLFCPLANAISLDDIVTLLCQGAIGSFVVLMSQDAIWSHVCAIKPISGCLISFTDE